MADISVKMGVSGIGQYKQAMKDATTSAKTLDAALKLNEKQFQATGNKEQFMQKQTELLGKKLQAQKQEVKAAEQALKTMAEQGVDKASAAYQQMQEKLLRAQAALLDTENAMKSVGQESTNAADRADEMAESLAGIGKKVNFDAVIGGIGKVTDAISGAAMKAIELGANLINSMKDAASWADELATNATIYGVSTTELQKMQYTADIIDTSVDTIMRSRQKLANNMVSGSEEVTQAFAELGVQLTETQGLAGKYGPEVVMRNWEDVFWDTGEALMKLGSYEEANAKATKIFGRSWEQLKPLFDSGWAEKGYDSARAYYEAVMESWNVVSEEDVDKLTELDDANQRLENELETLKNTVLAQLAPAFTDVTESIQGMIAALNEYLQTEEGQQKMKDLGDAVEKLFNSFTNFDPGAVIDFASDTLTKLTDGLEWISNNWETVEFGIKTIAAAFGLMQVSQTVLTALQLLASGKYLFGGGGTPTTTTTPTTSSQTPLKNGRYEPIYDAPQEPIFKQQPQFDTVPKEADIPQTSNWDTIKIALGSLAQLLTTFDPAGSISLIPELFTDKTAFGNALRNGAGVMEAFGHQLREIYNWGEEVGQNTGDWWNTRVQAAHISVEAIKKFFGDAGDTINWLFGSGDDTLAGALEEVYGEGGEGGVIENMTDAQIDAAKKYFKLWKEEDQWGSDETYEARDKLKTAFEDAGVTLSESAVELVEQVFANMMDENDPDGLVAKMKAQGVFDGDEWTSHTTNDPWGLSGIGSKGGSNLEAQLAGLEIILPTTPTVSEDAAEEIVEQIGPVEIPATIVPTAIDWHWRTAKGKGGGAGHFGYLAEHANGLPYVPFDGYPALLHKGERVVTAREMQSSRNFNSNLYVESMYMNNSMDAEALAAAMAAANRRTMMGFGS